MELIDVASECLIHKRIRITKNKIQLAELLIIETTLINIGCLISIGGSVSVTKATLPRELEAFT